MAEKLLKDHSRSRARELLIPTQVHPASLDESTGLADHTLSRDVAHERPAGGARTAPLEARLRSFAPLRPQDIDVVRACGGDLRGVHVGSDVGDGQSLDEHPRLIVSGWAAATRSLPDRRRQILHIFVPGDVLGLSSIRLSSAVALTAVTTTDARPLATALAAEMTAPDGLRLAWTRAQRAREQQLLDQIMRLGRLSAYERTAHLILELMDRHRQAGLSDGRRMPWPLTQETLADVLGLSVVHVNRILQQLRREGLIGIRAGQLLMPDPQRVAAVALWNA